jgi:hypothetical protein
MNIKHALRNITIGGHTKTFSLLVLVLLLITTYGGVTAQSDSGEDEVAHLLLQVEGTVTVSRDGWDILADSVAVSGSNLREGDYLVFSGSSRAVILCADLKLVEQFADGVANCISDPQTPAFYYADAIEWMPVTETQTVIVKADTSIPADAPAMQTASLSAEDGQSLATLQQSIGALGLEPEVQSYVMANLYARYELYYDAINELLQNETVQCIDRAVVRPTGSSSIFESPVTYIRLGEWNQFIGNVEASQRFFACGFQLAEELGDTGNAALAAARSGDVTTSNDEVSYYQQAIDRFASLDATENIDVLLGICGSRSCTDPR